MTRRLNLLPTQSGRAEPIGALFSAGAHGVIVGSILIGSAVGTVAWEAMGELPEGLRFLVPPPTSPAPAQANLGYATRVGDGGTSVATKTSDFGQLRAGQRSAATQVGGAGAVASMDAAAELAMMNALLANAYQVVEVDSAATHDPTSAAPVYPPALETRGIEGHVIVRFVVDSTGVVDMSTVMTIEATAAEFDRAVRDALPRMKFRPAKVGERRVRQLAEQLFKFEVQKDPTL